MRFYPSCFARRIKRSVLSLISLASSRLSTLNSLETREDGAGQLDVARQWAGVSKIAWWRGSGLIVLASFTAMTVAAPGNPAKGQRLRRNSAMP